MNYCKRIAKMFKPEVVSIFGPDTKRSYWKGTYKSDVYAGQRGMKFMILAKNASLDDAEKWMNVYLIWRSRTR